MDLATITVDDFKALFFRDFPYLPTNKVVTTEESFDYVLDADITKAFAEAKVVFNQALFLDDASIKMAYLYLTAHYLCLDLNAAMQGISGGGGGGILSSRTVGSVSESYGIPQRYLDSPQLTIYTKTNYGLKYLSLVLPKLVGNFGAVCGITRP